MRKLTTQLKKRKINGDKFDRLTWQIKQKKIPEGFERCEQGD